MRTIKFVNDTGAPVVLQAENNLSVADFIAAVLSQHNIIIDLGKVTLTELKTKAIFMTGDAILPDGDLKLFATVKDPKGNGKPDYASYNRKELYEAIKEFKESDGQRAATHFGQYGNITQVSSGDLVQLLRSYRPSKTKATSVKSSTKTTTGAISMRTPKRVNSSKSVNEDEDFVALKAAQKSYKPSFTRKNREA